MRGCRFHDTIMHTAWMAALPVFSDSSGASGRRPGVAWACSGPTFVPDRPAAAPPGPFRPHGPPRSLRPNT
jgi:hypothetical protein